MANDITTPGALLIKSMLPTDKAKAAYDVNRVLDKKGVQELMSNLILNGGSKAHDAIQDLSHLFFHTATVHGYTTPLADYENDSDERRQLIAEFKTKVNEVTSNKSLNEVERNNRLLEIASEYGDTAEKINLRHMVGKGSTAGKMAQTGARGNPMQLAQGTFSPLMSRDIEGKPLPIPIEHSFAEGLTPAEHLAMSYGGRASTVKAQLSTSEPGALFKQLVPNVYHETITAHDCGTDNGILVPVSDKPRIFNHIEAGTNKVIDDNYYKDLIGSSKKTVKIRSSLTCEAKDGVCQKCYGYDSRGAFPRIGENVGVIAAQSASETLTQAVLGTKHKGGVARRQRDTFEEAKNLLNMPESFKDEATISHMDGKVTKIEKTPLGDHNVVVNSVKHFVPNQQDVTVKVGDDVKQGQALSTGMINPKQLVALRGMGEGRKYLSNTMRDIYGSGLDPRHFDLIARNLVKYVRIKDPGNTDYLPGDIVDVSHVSRQFEEDAKKVGLTEAHGKKLAKKVLELMPGTKLDNNHVEYLANAGVNNVWVSNSGLEVEPFVKGIKTTKLLDKNWISRLSSSDLMSSLKDAAAYGEWSSIHSSDPIAPYVMGTEFGEGKEGRY